METFSAKDRPQGIGHQWVTRTENYPAPRTALGDKLIIIHYEDLVASPAWVVALARRLGLVVEPTLRADSNADRIQLEADAQSKIDAITLGTLEKLDDARWVRPPA